jgi:predicted ATPase
MIESLEIKNFRCFHDLALSGLGRINVLVGRNASGKTSLLEAIFLAAANAPDVALRLRGWRGMGDFVQFGMDRISYESVWSDLFNSLDQRRAIVISLRGSVQHTRSLTISYEPSESLVLPLGEQRVESAVYSPISFYWKDATGEVRTVRPELSSKGLVMGNVGPTMAAAFFASTFRGSPTETSARFSQLSKKGAEKRIVDALRKEFPFIESFSSEVNAGVYMVYAKIATMQEKIPVALLSDGVNKLLAIDVAIANVPNGVMLVDEIENGFYYDRLPNIWSSLLTFCQEYDVQLFASTHSKECLQAIGPAIRGNEREFCLIRMEKTDGECLPRKFDGREFQSALEQEVEFR